MLRVRGMTCFDRLLSLVHTIIRTICGRSECHDDVIYSGGALPWRRAPLWAALKSLLHVVCVMETTNVTDIHCSKSGLIYKIVIQNFLAFCLDKVEIDENEVGGISSSSICEGARKIVRRVAKLQKVFSEDHWYDDRFARRSLDFCERIVILIL